MRTAANVFKALSDETRLLMLALLFTGAGEMCVCDFMEVLQITQSKASRHLRHLVNAGFLDDRREGTWVYFQIRHHPEPLQAAIIVDLPELLKERLSPELVARFESWRHSKQRGETCTVQTSSSGPGKETS